ncbi:MAG TPA: AAA family ATPase [Methylocystis sp.]|jgi:hypothetical protein
MPIGIHPAGTMINAHERAKTPVLFGWPEFADRVPTWREIAATLEFQPNAEIGFCCGGQSGFCALDFDTEDKALQKIIQDVIDNMLPSAPLRLGKRTRIGAALYVWEDADEEPPSAKFVGADGATIFELLGHGRQIVMPPSVHPTKVPYEFADGEILPPPISELRLLGKRHVDALVAAIRAGGFAINQKIADRSARPTPEELNVYEKLIDNKKIVVEVKEYLQKRAPISIERRRGHDNACKVWHKCVDLGCDAHQAVSFMFAYWNVRCEPPWLTYESLEAELSGLMNSRSSPIGINSPSRLIAQYFREPDPPAKLAAPGTQGVTALFHGGDVPKRDKNVELVCLAKVEMEPIEWVWKDHLARTKLHILGGAKGDGKSTLAFQIATIVSTGGEFPDGSRATAGNVLIWSGEDGLKDTIVPRLAAMGADCNRIFSMSTVTDEDGLKRVFDPSLDLDGLRASIASLPGGRVALVIIDPLVSTMSANKDSHKNAETRQGLQHVVDFAEANRCAVLGIHHLTKGTRGNAPVERLTGSLAFGAIPRVVLMTAMRQEPEEGESPRVLVRAASNIGPSGGGFGYDTEQATVKRASDGLAIEATRIKWGERIEGGAKTLLDAAETPEATGEKRRPALAAAKMFLADMLRDGPRLAKDIFVAAAGDGHAKRTLKRAKDDMRIKSHGPTGGEGWKWALPDDYSAFFVPDADGVDD